MNSKFIFLFLTLIFLVGSVSALPVVSIGETNTGIGLPSIEVNPPITSSNVSANVSHNSLSGLQGGTATERFHLNSSVYSYLISNIYSWVTSVTGGNPFDQVLNTTSNVKFNSVNATTGNFTDLYVSNSSIYIGSDIKLSADTIVGVLNVTGGNISSDYYYGSGKYLTDLNLTNISFSGDTINASVFNGGNFTGDYFTLNGTTITDWNDLSVKVFYENRTITTSGGSGINTSSLINFQLNRIQVTPNNLNHPYMFEAIETSSGDYVDKNRIAHVGVWDIKKNYALDDTINLSITGSSPDDTFTIKLTYLNNNLI